MLSLDDKVGVVLGTNLEVPPESMLRAPPKLDLTPMLAFANMAAMKQEPISIFCADTDSPGKRAVIAAALRLFALEGVEGVTIRHIGSAAGLTNPAMFRHFKSKDDLAFHLFLLGYASLSKVVLDALADEDADVERALRSGLELIETSAHGVHFVIENIPRYFSKLPAEMRRESLLSLARRLAARDQERGRLRSAVDPELYAMMILGTLSQAARMAIFGELSGPATGLATGLIEIFHHGVKEPS